MVCYKTGSSRKLCFAGAGVSASVNAVELVLFEISNSMKPYPSVFHACTSKYIEARDRLV